MYENLVMKGPAEPFVPATPIIQAEDDNMPPF